MKKKDPVLIVLEKFAALLMAMLIVFIAVQVVTRYCARSIPVWCSEEVTTLIFIWLAMTGACIAAARKAHVGVDVLTALVPAGAKIWLERLVYLIACVFLVYFCYVSANLAWVGRLAGTPRLSIPMVYVQGSIPFGMLFMGYFFAKHFITSFSREKDTIA